MHLVMIRTHNESELRDRAGAVKRWAGYGAILCLVAAAMALTLLGGVAGASMTDVHIPAEWAYTVDRYRVHFLPGEPYSVGHGGYGECTEIARRLSSAASYLGFGFLIFGLFRRNRKIVVVSVASMALISSIAPYSEVLQSVTPMAVSVDTARAMQKARTAKPSGKERRDSVHLQAADAYIDAQIKFISGDRKGAALASRDLREVELLSPIEAPYRLQFLKGQPPEARMSKACFSFGCLREDRRAIAQFAILAIAFLSGLASLGLLYVWRTLSLRVSHIADLYAKPARRLRMRA